MGLYDGQNNLTAMFNPPLPPRAQPSPGPTQVPPTTKCGYGEVWRDGPQGPGCYTGEAGPHEGRCQDGSPGPYCPNDKPADPTNGNRGSCPEGQEHGGGHPGNPCRPVQGGGGGGGGGGGTAAAPLVSGVQPGDDVEKQIWDYINGILSGKNTAYNDQVVGNMKQDAFRTATGRASADKNALSEDLISRGIFRSGIASSGMSSIDRGASAQYSKSVGDINQQKALSDFSNRMQALTAAQQWLDSKRTYLIQKESNAIQREIGLAQIKLGYAKIASEKELLQLQLSKMGGGGGGGSYDPVADACRYNPSSPYCSGSPPSGG